MTLCGSWLQSAIVLGMNLYLYASVDVLTREDLLGWYCLVDTLGLCIYSGIVTAASPCIILNRSMSRAAFLRVSSVGQPRSWRMVITVPGSR